MATTKETVPTRPETPAPEQRGGFFTSYKEDQGRLVRMAAFWSVAFFVVFGCKFLHDILVQYAAMQVPIAGIHIPVVGVDLTGAFLVGFVLFCAGMAAIWRWQQRPKVANLLIETEAELKKITWPKGQEVVNAALVVIVFVVVIGLFLAFADWFVSRVMRYLLFGEV
jgi:preprotein translocase SecE subunit